MNYILLIKTFIQAAKDVEALMPNSKGQQKFEAAIAIVEEIFGNLSGMLPGLLQLATTVVNAFHATGIFKKKQSEVEAA